MKIAETERLAIRWFTKDDADFIYQLLNSPGWLQYVGNRNIDSIAAAEQYITGKFMSNYEKNGYGFYMVELKDSKTPIGTAGIIKRDHLEHIDLGFAFLPGYEGKGYAFEASRAVMKYAASNFKTDTLLAIVLPENKRSVALLEKLDFVVSGSIQDDGEELLLFRNDQLMQ